MHDVCSIIEYRYREKVRLNYIPALFRIIALKSRLNYSSSCIVLGEKAVFRSYKSGLGGKDIFK